MKRLNAYIQLLRINKPIGTLLLWYPTAWALWIAGKGEPSLLLILYFFLGTFIMRSAGCLINDIVDRDIDPHVKRTKSRPLATDDISLQNAFRVLIALLCIAFVILLQLPNDCFYYALLSVIVTVLYPFCKRFLSAPQFILGIAFSMGIPMAYTALGAPFDMGTFVLWLLNFSWIVAYDTIYAMSDKPDDLKIGVHSTAVLFGNQDKNMVLLFQIVTQFLWLILADLLNFHPMFYLTWIAGTVFFIQQQVVIRDSEPNYLKTFTSNSYYGLLMWTAISMVY